MRNNSKCFWNFINSKRKTTGYPSCMKFNDSTTSDVQIICNLFARYFQSVYSSELFSNQELPSVSKVFDIGSMILDVSEVEQALLELDASKNEGPDGIPPIIFHKCARSLAKPLTDIFNASLSEGKFLDSWKLSFLTPVFKSGSK
ncbi:uncharacterized protein LOC129941651 [Eupeodes corollae]|uniref:uncharacterized protein LOC129941651 n=1 Tax=Eupeodes corollae TaxID=290404 RepID=UPI00248FFF01|nr:uncharacterized protein LOC129941651 [Eupeodes corollae]